LIEKYGDQLQIIGVDVTQPEGQTLFLSALKKFNLQSNGVPFLVIGEIYLIGSVDIPEKLPTLIDTYLAQGGSDLPAIPGLQEALEAPTTAAPQTDLEPDSAAPSIPSLTGSSATKPTWQENFTRDLAGNSLAVIVLIGIVAALIWVLKEFRKKQKTRTTLQRTWLIPILCLLGVGVAGYLAYVETANVTAVCGPVGDCNTVQQSEYARLFGILPIGVLGLLGYIAIAAASLLERLATSKLAIYASIALLAFSSFGALFSAYLTFLEPFVIGATCAWCLASAVIITSIMVLSVQPAKQAMSKLK
jgi:uncharacterized membrane protein